MHWKTGENTEYQGNVICLDAMKHIALHPALAGLSFILEKPNDDWYIEEIHTVLRWMKEVGSAVNFLLTGDKKRCK